MSQAPAIGKSIAFWLLTTILLLLPGVGLVIAGATTWIAGDALQNVHDAGVGDNDLDGKDDEDPYGDADNSRNDPTQVDGPAEITNPWDDDADGQTDEDPAPRADVRAGLAGVSQLGSTFTFFGAVLLVAYASAVVVRTARQHRLKLARIHSAPFTVALEDPPAAPHAPR